jgi:hypothetical protein
MSRGDRPAPISFQLNLGILSYSGLEVRDGFDDGIHEAAEHSEYVSALNVAEEYRRGAVGIAIEFNVAAGRDAHDRDDVADTADELVALHSNRGATIRVEDLKGGMGGSSEYRPDSAMLVGNVHFVKSREDFPFASGEGPCGDQQVNDPSAGGDYAPAPGFVIRSVISADKRQLLVLRAAIPSDKLPDQMVKNRPQIVDSVAYYDREGLRHLFNDTDLNNWLATMWVMLDPKSVRLAQHKGFELPFKVSNVMLCTSEFLPSAIEHG